MYKLIDNIGMLATPEGSAANGGISQGEIKILDDAWIVIEDSLIKEVGTGAPPELEYEEYIDAGGQLVTPGLVDAHTHLVFGGWRQNELGMKLHGMSYMEIHNAGGGIISTVKATRAASREELYEEAYAALDEMMLMGVTSCEAKSGYGLDRDTEIKQLEVINKLGEGHPMDIARTFLGAHDIPEEFKDDREAYIKFLIDEMIPEVAERGLADFCDVFCEKGVFTAEESMRILRAGIDNGLRAKIHSDEIEHIGGTELTAELKAISAEHLIVCQPSGIEAMAQGGTVACLLPATSFYLGSVYAPAREMIKAGVPVAIASDFNPGSCPSLNLQFAMNLGCLRCKLTPEEMLTAVTLNGAAAIGLAELAGSLETGKQADIVIWNAPDLNYLGYRLGSNLAYKVIKRGNQIN